MANHIDGNGEAIEDGSIAITKNHLGAIPECVVVLVAVMDRGQQIQAIIVDRVTTINIVVKIERGT